MFPVLLMCFLSCEFGREGLKIQIWDRKFALGEFNNKNTRIASWRVISKRALVRYAVVMVSYLHTPKAPLGSPLTQKALSRLMKHYNSQYRRPIDCQEELLKLLFRLKEIECTCGSREIDRKYGERTGRCKVCHKTINLTANTFLHGMRNPRAWHLALWLRQRGVSLSAKRFSEIAGIAQSTAWCMFKKIEAVILANMTERFWLLYSGLLLTLLCKRSTETPRRQHPRAEQDEYNEAYSLELGTASARDKIEQGSSAFGNGERDKNAAYDSLTDEEKGVYHFISDQRIHFDRLSDLTELPSADLSSKLTALELAGLIERWIGDWYVRIQQEVQTQNAQSQAPVTETQNAIVVHIEKFTKRVFSGFSRKYVQCYLAEFWYFVDRAYWQEYCIFEACLSYGRLRIRTIKNSVSPLMVKVMPQSVAL